MILMKFSAFVTLVIGSSLATEHFKFGQICLGGSKVIGVRGAFSRKFQHLLVHL